MAIYSLKEDVSHATLPSLSGCTNVDSEPVRSFQSGKYGQLLSVAATKLDDERWDSLFYAYEGMPTMPHFLSGWTLPSLLVRW